MYDLHHSLSILPPPPSPSVLQARKPEEPFCVNSLIRKTLTRTSHPLFLFILVGKYFIDFCSNRRRAEMRGALCGIRLCGGFPGRVGEPVMSLLVTPTSSHPLNEPITAVILQPSSPRPVVHMNPAGSQTCGLIRRVYLLRAGVT